MSKQGSCWVYFLACGRAAIYVGVSVDPIRRALQHLSGLGGHYTQHMHPHFLIGGFRMSTRREALQLEYRLKRLPHITKLMIAELSTASPEWQQLVEASRTQNYGSCVFGRRGQLDHP